MKEFVPLYESMYDNEKLGMSHVARSVYGGLCLKARKDKGDRVRLPRGEQDLVHGVWRLLGGKPEEVQAALDELRDEQDPMVRVEGEPGRFAIVLLAEPRWRLPGRQEGAELDGDEDEQPAPLDGRSGAARRQAAYRRRNATRNADRNDPHNGGHNADRNATRNAVGGKGGSLVETSEKEEKRREEEARARAVTGRNADRNGERNADGVTASRPGLVETLRSHPELVEYEQMGQLKLKDCAENLKSVADGFVMNGKLRREDVRERLEWAISEVAREVRSANQTSGPLQAKVIAKKLETFASTNLGRSREQWEADRALREGRPSRPGASPAPPLPKIAAPGSIERFAAAKKAE